ncbi:MAG: DUF983 domain-containing protein [Thermomicrobiales bacterium]
MTTTFGRALRLRRPYRGAGSVFEAWFTLKKLCPGCGTRYAREVGYFLGSYVINLGVIELLTVAIVVWLIAGTDLSVLQMQIYGVALAVALLLCVALDISIHPPTDSRPRVRR